MTASALLAEKIRGVTRTGTDYAVAKALGISQSGLKQVLLGERNLGPESCVRAAELLGVALADVLAEVELSKAKTPEKKAFWEKRLPRLLPTLVIWGCSVGVTLITLSARASDLTTVSQAIHYAHRLYIRTVHGKKRRRDLAHGFSTWFAEQIHWQPAKSPACRGLAPLSLSH